MTIDIIAAAQADRQTKLDQILALQLDVIEIDAFIAKARAYAGEGENEPESTTPETSNSGASDDISDDLSTAPSEAETPADAEDPTPEAAPGPKPMVDTNKTGYERILEAYRANPTLTARELGEIAGVPKSTASAYLSRVRRDVAAEEAQQAAPAPAEPAEPEPAPAAPQESSEALLQRAREFTQPAGTKFRLKHPQSGLYLHESLTRDRSKALQVTAYKDFAWCQPEARLLKVRQLHPEVMDWAEEVVLP